LKSIDLEILIT